MAYNAATRRSTFKNEVRRMIRSAAFPVLIRLALSFGCAGPPEPLPGPGSVAAAYADAGRYDEAAREIDLAVRIYPRDVSLRMQAAEIHELAGNAVRAVGHLEAALLQTPSESRVWLMLGDIETRRENTADAYVAYRRASELAPREVRAVAGLALAADKLGFAEEAEVAYARWAALERELGVDSTPEAEK